MDKIQLPGLDPDFKIVLLSYTSFSYIAGNLRHHTGSKGEKEEGMLQL